MHFSHVQCKWYWEELNPNTLLSLSLFFPFFFFSFSFVYFLFTPKAYCITPPIDRLSVNHHQPVDHHPTFHYPLISPLSLSLSLSLSFFFSFLITSPLTCHHQSNDTYLTFSHNYRISSSLNSKNKVKTFNFLIFRYWVLFMGFTY